MIETSFVDPIPSADHSF